MKENIITKNKKIINKKKIHLSPSSKEPQKLNFLLKCLRQGKVSHFISPFELYEQISLVEESTFL